MFSIIIPTYNSEHTIATAIASVLNQTYSNFEIVIIDGASTDTTLSVIKNFALSDSRIRYSSEKDRGIYDAMNKGIDRARGEWLLFLGSDDSLYHDDTLFKVNQVIKNNKATRLIFGNVYTSEGWIQKYANYDFTQLTKLNICHQAIFYHRSLFNKLKYNLHYRIFADWDFNLKVFKEKNFPTYIDEIVCRFNLDGTSKNFRELPEYAHFVDPLLLVKKYKGRPYFYWQRLKQLITKAFK